MRSEELAKQIKAGNFRAPSSGKHTQAVLKSMYGGMTSDEYERIRSFFVKRSWFATQLGLTAEEYDLLQDWEPAPSVTKRKDYWLAFIDGWTAAKS